MNVSCEKFPPGQFFTELANIHDPEILSYKWTEFHNNSYEKETLSGQYFLANVVNLCPPKGRSSQ